MAINCRRVLPEVLMDRIQRHSAGTEGRATRHMKCHHCEHNSIVVFENSTGYIQIKCKKCGAEGIYNLMLRRNIRPIFY